MVAMARPVSVAVLGAVLSAGCGSLPDYGYEAETPDASRAPSAVIIRVNGAPRYPIRLSWPAEKGMRGRLDTTTESTRTSTQHFAGGATDVETHHVRVSAKGVEEILEADDRGNLRRARVDFDLLDADFGPSRSPLHLRDVRAEIARGAGDAEATVTLGGAPASGDDLEAVREIFAPGERETPSDDQAFGTATPQAVGDVWPIQGDVVERTLAEGFPVPPGAVTGAMSLVSATSRDGIPCLEIKGSVRIEPFGLSGLPAGATVEHAAIVLVMHVVVPTSPMFRIEDDSTMTTDVTVTTPEGDAVETHTRKAAHRSVTPLGPAP